MMNVNLNPSLRNLLSLIAIITVTLWALPGPALEESDIETETFGVAIKGYDPVAYYTEGHPVKGKSEFAYTWNEAEWFFASAEHRDLFAANPKKYAPNHGGF
jgi:YHS domain-containing protein